MEQGVEVLLDGIVIQGDLGIPDHRPRGVVIFAHGSGSSRHSPRNRMVAFVLREAGIATLLIDLLTEEEEREDLVTRRHRFDIPLLARRLQATTQWAVGQEQIGGLPAGYFGASTGAAAALVADAERPGSVAAIVSRGGRPDLAGEALKKVAAPTLLIVGGADREVLGLNQQAAVRMKVETSIEVVPGAGHLFEEPGALESVARLAREWFLEHFGR